MVLVELLLVIVLGLALGSFVSMASYRLPREEEVVFKPSSCAMCQAPLSWSELFPIASWLFASGKCRHCGGRISIRYPLIEVATAAMCLLVYMLHGFGWYSLFLMLFGSAMMTMLVCDLEHFIIPDEIQIFLLPLGILTHIYTEMAISEIVIGMGSGLLLGLILYYGYFLIFKKYGLGFGDVKFLGVAGLWLGFKAIAPFLILSGLLGILTGLVWQLAGKGRIYPFGPALALALFICVVVPQVPQLFWDMLAVRY